MSNTTSFVECPSFEQLEQDANEMKSNHISQFVEQNSQTQQFEAHFNGIHVDFTRQNMNSKVLQHLLTFMDEQKVCEKIKDMFDGKKVNITENRPALHTLLRTPKDKSFMLEGVNVINSVHTVLDRIQAFSTDVRSGKIVGCFGDKFDTVVCVGIGGSYLATEFLYEALLANTQAYEASNNMQIKFLANVDPINFTNITKKINPKTTLVIIISKTFTTAETMLNAQLMKEWLIKTLSHEQAVEKHMIAVSTNLPLTQSFGINPNNVFGFWDWVGGRFSVTSAVGILPISIIFGFEISKQFLSGCYDMDTHFANTPTHANIPMLMAMTSFWNSTFMQHKAVAVLPYCQALHRFTAHIQQLVMESNGKTCNTAGRLLTQTTSEIYFGEPGTNGQHSFYQLLHQGQTIPAEFIGFCKPPNNVTTEKGKIGAHDELMTNFFAQPDALAFGKTFEMCAKEGIPDWLLPHRFFPGNRPSIMLLLPELNAYYLGCLLSLYENRTVTQAFMWGINPFDQWGVELGKVAAKEVRKYFEIKRSSSLSATPVFCNSTQKFLDIYLSQK